LFVCLIAPRSAAASSSAEGPLRDRRPYLLPIAAVLIVADVVVGVVSGTATPFVIAPVVLASLGQVALLPGTYQVPR
jgi:hypothetical protein